VRALSAGAAISGANGASPLPSPLVTDELFFQYLFLFGIPAYGGFFSLLMSSFEFDFPPQVEWFIVLSSLEGE